MAGEYVWSGGNAVGEQSVPSIGGPAKIMAGGHVNDGNRAEGVAYNTDASIGEKLDTGAYPGGTTFADPTPGESVN